MVLTTVDLYKKAWLLLASFKKIINLFKSVMHDV